MRTASTRSKTMMSSSSSSQYQPFDYLGCSNCANDFIANQSTRSASFWLMECGHLSCASCLGFPDASTLDTTQQYRCPIPSCGGAQSAVYELSGQIPLHPAIQEFFETPDSITQRLESVLTFQNRQMRLRIKNLHKLVELQRQTLRRNQSALAVLPTFKQQIYDLKRELNHWRSLQQKPSGPSKPPSTQAPSESNPVNEPAKNSITRPLAVVDQNHQIPQGIISDHPGRLTPVHLNTRHRRTWPSSHQQSFNNSPILPPQSPDIGSHQPRASRASHPYNLNTPAKLPRTISLGVNSDHSRNDLRHRQSAFGVHRRSSSGEMNARIATDGEGSGGPRVYDGSLQVIPEDEDEPTNHQAPFTRVPRRNESMSSARGQYIRRPLNQAVRPTGQRQAPQILPMPLPAPSRVPSSNRAQHQPGRNQNPLGYPASTSALHPSPQQNPSVLSPLNPSHRFTYHEDQNQSRSKINHRTQMRQPENHPQMNQPFPFNIKRLSANHSAENPDRASPKRRLNSFTNAQPGSTPRYRIDRGHPPQPP